MLGPRLPMRKIGDVLLRMTPNGVVTGKVVDEDREPIAFLTRYDWWSGCFWVGVVTAWSSC